MKFVKDNLFLVILGTVMFIITVAGGYLIFTTAKKASDFEQQVGDIKNQLDAFTKSEYTLQPTSVTKAEKNRQVAEAAYKALLDDLVKKTAVPPADATSISPIAAKNRIEKACTKMEGMLAGNSVQYDPGMRHFTFGSFMDANRLPKKEEIPLILRNQEIVQELIYLVSTSNVQTFHSISREDTLEANRRDLFNYIPFSLSVTGELEDVQRLVNSFNNATYYYFVRAVTLSSDGGLADGVAPDGAADGPASSKKKVERLLRKSPTMVTATLQVDYIEFHDKE